MPLRNAKILFIGNSFTTRNDLPALWAGLAAAGGSGTQIESEVVAAGGASLRQHLNKGTAALLLAEGGWDFVVLQEQSTLPVKNPQRTHENIRDFHGIITDNGARTVLYMTWARLHAPEAQATLSATYDDIGAELGVTVVPAGLAWQRALTAAPAPVLHYADKSHPTLAGSYLAACCFQLTLFGAPLGEPTSSDGIPVGERTALCAVAQQVCAARSETP
jgi:hypothetical protein